MKKLLFLILLIPFFVQAQIITIGTGTNENNTTQSSPVNIWYRRTVCQMVYTVAELNAAGLNTSKQMNALGFFITQSPLYEIPGYQIQMKHTNLANANNNFGTTGWSIVKNAYSYLPNEGGWDLISFDSPFTWNSTQNIVIQICCSQVQPTYNASGQCRVFNSTNGYRYRWADAAGNSCGEIPNTNLGYKPQIQFVFDTTTTWTGAISSNWQVNGNWTNGVPNEKIDAIIPTSTPNNPIIYGPAVCDELILNGTLTISTTQTLSVFSHFTHQGNLIENGGSIIFKGNKPCNFNLINDLTVNDLKIEKPATVSLSGTGTLSILNELEILDGGFNTNDAVIIKSTELKTGRIAPLQPTCQFTLNMQDSWGDGWNGGYLNIIVNGVSIGLFSAVGFGSSINFQAKNGSSITLNYTSGSWENENTYQLLDSDGNTLFSAGTFPNTGNVFNTNANCSFSTLPIQGEIAMERYIDAGETYWRFFSSAVTGATIADYQDDFTTSGYPGSPFPSFPFTSIYTYNETLPPGLGYVPVSSSSQIIGVGQGLWVWSGDTITGTEPFLVDLHGVPNQGNITMPVTFTNTGTFEEDGWNLVGNPYPSSIDWDSPNWTKTNIANAIYVLDPDNRNYATYISGVSINGGSRYIASQQAFWVYATASSPLLVATENVKTNVDASFFRSLNSGMKITVSGNSKKDECVMRHIEGTVNEFEPQYDALKFFNWSSSPNISLINNENKDLTVHTFDKNYEEWTIPLRVVVPVTGNYELSFNGIEELNVPCLFLEDTYTSNIYPIEEGSVYTFELYNTVYSPRFLIHVGKNYDTSISPVTCFNGNDGVFELNLNSDTNYDYILTGTSGSVSGNSTGNPLIIDNLYSDFYHLHIPDLTNMCDNQIFDFSIYQSSQILVSETINHIVNGNDGEITVTISGGNPPYELLWNNGETTNEINSLSEGEYQLSVVDANGCIWEDSFYINSSLNVSDLTPEENVKIYYLYDLKKIHITDLSDENIGELNLYNIEGKLIYSTEIIAGQEEYFLNVPLNLPKGTYILKGNKIVFKFLN